MSSQAPTRQIIYVYNGVETIITEKCKWVNPDGKTTKQVLLEIGNEIYKSQHKKEDVDDLLNQASAILWREFQDDNHPLYSFIQAQLKGLGEYSKQRSQIKKDYLLKDIAKESRFRIEHYFERGDK
ncbi:hypothetical protein [Hymenobacter elongatus]|uniref:Uncharacterized protein n=1 Tax=Hymenobacter elongatus TaxID=877208 RepID=A0A4Z0PFZ2_9BACT|nr:hypothetical protein [Hymenobacter elongatus]TGE13923.1 hypothetical protein E5J99_18185 [Hymenobacter elongatus]